MSHPAQLLLLLGFVLHFIACSATVANYIIFQPEVEELRNTKQKLETKNKELEDENRRLKRKVDAISAVDDSGAEVYYKDVTWGEG